MFTLGDLAIAARLVGTASEAWEVFTPDVDLSGNVDDFDLIQIVNEILSN